MADMFKYIESKARKGFPAALAPVAKTIIAYPRYYAQLRKARSQYNIYKDNYKQHILFVAGLPKSGTTWFEKMLGSFPGLTDIMIPEAVAYEQKHKQSHSFEFPDNLFSRFNNALAVVKLHAHGSQHNFQLLQQSNIKYVVMFRDLRDVAVSHSFYVKRTAYHPEHSIYKNLDTKQSLHYFADTLLPQFVQWVESWQQHASSSLSYIIKYEDLVANTLVIMKAVADHYGIQATNEMLQNIIEKNSFETLSGGRQKGNKDAQSFFRSGTAGDWKNYFDDALISKYNTILADFNKKYSYEM